MSHYDHSLKTLIKSEKFNFSQDHLIVLIYNILCAVKYLHSANILHRDIKPSNILINNQCKVNFCDFGWSRTISNQTNEKKKPRQLTPTCFTRFYRPPEVILARSLYTSKADAWSLGVTIAELVLRLNRD